MSIDRTRQSQIEDLTTWFLTRTEVRRAVRVYNNAAISLANATATVLTFNSERYDTDNMHSTSVNTDRLTCTMAGRYVIFANITFAANTTGRRFVLIRLNGVTDIARDLRNASTDAGATTSVGLVTEYDLAVGDYLTVIALQASGGALDVSAVSNYSPEFGMVLVA